MTPQEQNRAIAEACGWTVHHGGKYVHPVGIERFSNVIVSCVDSLDAMHEAEKVIGISPSYAYELNKIVANGSYPQWLPQDGARIYEILHATASQRAEAFLRTLNLWKE